jgi:hypothetical protein
MLEYRLKFSGNGYPGIDGVAYFHRKSLKKAFDRWVVRISYRTPDDKILAEKVKTGTAGSGFNPNMFLDNKDTRKMIASMASAAAKSAANEIKNVKKLTQTIMMETSKRLQDLDIFVKDASRVGKR